MPAGGISVYEHGDDAVAPIAELPAGHEVVVIGRRGTWVHVNAGDGLDGWVSGTALAGVAVGASAAVAPASPTAVPAAATASSLPKAVVEKQPSSLLIGAGPVVGALGGVIAIVGALLAWQQTVANRLEVNAFDIPVAFLGSWDKLGDGGFSIGLLVVILAGVGTLVSLISGGGVVRRILGFAVVVIAVVFVLQQQDLLTSNQRGLGTGLNVWDIADYGVVVSFLGGIVMTAAPSR